MRTTLLTILIPVYNEQECIYPLYKRIFSVSENIHPKVEILFVNDGSTDLTLSLIKKLQAFDARVSYINLSRNFGKEKAMCAGINYIHGDALVIIDADLQDPPELIPQMLEELEKGYDDVYACRSSRKGETWFKQWSARKYYRCLHFLSNIPVQENTGDFRMLSANVIHALHELKESERNLKGLFSYVGFKKKAIYYERDARFAGRTKWKYIKLIDLAINGLTSFSILPLRLVSIVGFIVSIIAFVYLFVIVVKLVLWGDTITGYSSLMCMCLFIGGFVLLALGIIGEYLGIVYNETKKRPIYFVNEYSASLVNKFSLKDYNKKLIANNDHKEYWYEK